MIDNHNTVSSVIGERIREFRTKQNLSQEELAFAAGIHSAYIGKVERGEKCPTIETLYKISIGLKLPLNRLVDIDSETVLSESDSMYRIKKVLENMTPEKQIKIAAIIEDIASLI